MVNIIKFYSLFQFSLSIWLNGQGAPLFSMLDIILFRSVGAALCSITKYLLISKIIDNGLILTGQASTQALQLVQAHNSSCVI